MDGAEDGAILICHGLQGLHNVLRHKGVQAGRRLVTEHQWGIGQQLHTNKIPITF